MRPLPPVKSASAPSPSSPPPMPTSPWHSPVPYLFGGLAAMLGLIALALLILACSYWKLNSYLGAVAGDDDADPGAATDGGPGGSKSPAVANAASPAAFADLVAVVMAGDKTPTFLAAPAIVVHRATPAVPAAEENSGKHDGESGGVVDDDDAEGADRRRTDHV